MSGLRRRVNWRPRPGARYCVIPEDFNVRYEESTAHEEEEAADKDLMHQVMMTSPGMFHTHRADEEEQYSGYFDMHGTREQSSMERKTKSLDITRQHTKAKGIRSYSSRLLLFFKASDGLATVTS